MVMRTKTLRPGEHTATEIFGDLDDQRRPEEPIAVAVMREGFAQLNRQGGNRPLWLAFGLLAAAFVWHLQGDGTVREEARRTNVLVTWLVRCELARQNGEKPPELPYPELM